MSLFIGLEMSMIRVGLCLSMSQTGNSYTVVIDTSDDIGGLQHSQLVPGNPQFLLIYLDVVFSYAGRSP